MIALLLAAALGQDLTLDAKDLPKEHAITVPGPGMVTVEVVEAPARFTLGTSFPEGVPHSTSGQARVTTAGEIRVVLKERYNSRFEGKLVVRFVFTAENDPSEPNDDRAQARAITAGDVSLAIFPFADADFLAIDLPDAGYLMVTAPKAPRGFSLRAQVLNSAGEPAGSGYVRIDLPGRYVIRVDDAYGLFSSTTPFEIKVAILPEDDPLEPNDTPELATRIDLGSWYSAVLAPANDVDVFEVEVAAAGTLTPAVQNAAGRVDWSCTGPTGKASSHPPFAVQPGRYKLSMWTNSSRVSHTPFEFRIAWAPAQDELEPNDEKPVEIEPGRMYRITCPTADDLDRFRVKAPGPGILTLRAVGDAPAGLLFACGGRSGRELTCRITGAVDIVVGAQSSPSPDPFYIVADWVADEDGEPNDSRETATKIEFGTAAGFRLWPVDDCDWFRVEVPGPGHLVALVHCGALKYILGGRTIHVEVFDAEGKPLGELGQDPRRKETYGRTMRIQAAGTCYLRVRFDAAEGDEPFSLTSYFLEDNAAPPTGDSGGVVVYILGVEPDEKLAPELKLLARTAHGTFMAADKVDEIAPKLEDAVKRATEEAARRQAEAPKAAGGRLPLWLFLVPMAAVAAVIALLLRRKRATP